MTLSQKASLFYACNCCIMGKLITHYHQEACFPSRHVPSACTSPPYAPFLPAEAWGTSGRHADTPSVPPPPGGLPLRCQSTDRAGARWRGRIRRPRSRLTCRRGSGSLSPGCWRWRWRRHASIAVTGSPGRGNLWLESQLVCSLECPDRPELPPSRC